MTRRIRRFRFVQLLHRSSVSCRPIAIGVGVLLTLVSSFAPAMARSASPSRPASRDSSGTATLSPHVLDLLLGAAADSSLAPWQREALMRIVSGYPGAVVETTPDAGNEAAPMDADGLWKQAFAPDARAGQLTLDLPTIHRMVIFGGNNSYEFFNDLWKLDLENDTGWSKIPSAGPVPEERSAAAGIYDPLRDRILIFGGYNYGYLLNDVWSLSLGTMTWTELFPSGPAPVERKAASAVYDPVGDRMLLFGGYDGFTCRSDLWSLSLGGSPAWTRLTPGGCIPPARFGQNAIHDPSRNRIVFFGGADGLGEYRNDAWALDLASLEWSNAAPSGGPPIGRYVASAALDPPRDRILVFGGNNGPELGDVWALDLAANSWTEIQPTGTSPGIRAWASMVYDATHDRFVFFGGIDGFKYRNDTWALSLDPAPAWGPLFDDFTPPPSRWQAAGTYDSSRNELVMFGGVDGSTYFNDVWRLHLASPLRWTKSAPTGTAPSKRRTSAVIYDPAHDRVLVFGGSDSGGILKNDVWSLTTGDASWVQITPSGTPPAARYGHTAVYDPTGNRMIVFSGASGPGQYRNDTWQLTLGPSPTWTQLFPSGSPPPVRYLHSATYDPIRNRMIVFGGNDGPNQRNDAWSLDLAAPGWTQLAPSGPIPTARSGHSAVYDSDRDRLILFGGSDGTIRRNDSWELTLSDSGTWTELATPAPPVGRQNHVAAYDPDLDEMVVFGGYSGETLDDTWLLLLSPEAVGTPEADSHSVLQLLSGYPNPFTAGATIPFELPAARHVRIVAFDISGRAVRTLVDENRGAGSNSVVWDGTDDRGRPVASGVYLLQLSSGGETITRKITMAR